MVDLPRTFVPRLSSLGGLHQQFTTRPTCRVFFCGAPKITEMEALQTLFSKSKAGQSLWVSPADLGVSVERFDAIAKKWKDEGGGENFTYLDSHRETGTGLRLIDRVRIRYDGPMGDPTDD